MRKRRAVGRAVGKEGAGGRVSPPTSPSKPTQAKPAAPALTASAPEGAGVHYRAALQSVRQAALCGVSEAIASAEETPVPVPVLRRERERHAGSRAHAIFDGITTALADQILTTARPGCETEMALQVSRLLMSKVASASCAGSA